MGIGEFKKRVMNGRPDHFFMSDDGNLFDTRNPNWSQGRPLRPGFAGHAREVDSVAQIKAALRAGPYVWPGGYELFAVTSDGAALCFDCVKAEFRQIAHSTRHRLSDGWRIIGFEIADWLECEVMCENCNRVISEAEESDE